MHLLLIAAALAEDPVDLGVLKNSDLRVVQKVLYAKEKRLEVGASIGVMPFDMYTVAPQLAGSATLHLSEKIAAEIHVGGGYGLKTARYAELEGPQYGVAVEAYRYLASVAADVQWSPIYAKLNMGKGVILHHDVYVLAGVGATLEQSVFPTGYIAIAPTLPVGIGTRIWVGPNTAVRAEFRDNLMLEHRQQSGTTAFKQNAAVTVGIAMFGKKK